MVSFDLVFKAFLNRITDYGLAELTDEEVEEDLVSKLVMALGKFDLNGDIVVDYDNRTLTNTNNANGNLTPNEIDIIVSYMIVEWIAPLKNSEEILKSNLSSQEYSRVAQTNMLDKLIKTYNDAEQRAERLRTRYSYRNGLLKRVKERNKS